MVVRVLVGTLALAALLAGCGGAGRSGTTARSCSGSARARRPSTPTGRTSADRGDRARLAGRREAAAARRPARLPRPRPARLPRRGARLRLVAGQRHDRVPNVEGDYYALWTLDVASGRKTQLTRPPGLSNDAEPRWAPDGERLLFQRDGDVWVVGRDGRDAHLLLRGARDARWSPDGDWVAFVKDAPTLIDDILVVGRRRTAATSARSPSRAPTRSSPGGRTGARSRSFAADRPAPALPREAPDFAPRPLLADAEGAPAWSPTGRRLAVAAGEPPAIWVVDAEDGDRAASRPAAPTADPTWEPRGLAARALGGCPATASVHSPAGWPLSAP